MTEPDDGSRRRFLKAMPMLGLAAALGPGTMGSAFADSKTTKKGTMTPVSGELAAGVRPFQVEFPEAVLTDLRKRVNATRWPQRETVADTTQGVQLETMRRLASYWGKDHDPRKGEAKLKAVPHFVTEIDGLDIHFIHVRSKHEHALPVIITHGWPGSVVEQLKIIEPLTNPTAHDGTAADAFDVVIPSLPGYGYSGKPTAPGWQPLRIAKAWIELMNRLGYKRYVAQGGDWGNAVSETMALMAPVGLLGIHTNMPATIPPEIAKALATGGPPPAGLSADEKNAYEMADFFYKKGLGYANEMGLRPQTLYGIVDSPIGLAAWILDHDARSYDLIARVFAGGNEGLTRDDILDNITLYWVTNTEITSARLYWETLQLPAKGGFFDARGVAIPVAVSVFPDEIYAAPRSWAERAYPKLIHFNKLPKGCHFAAWEQPAAFTSELRAGFKTLRS